MERGTAFRTWNIGGIGSESILGVADILKWDDDSLRLPPMRAYVLRQGLDEVFSGTSGRPAFHAAVEHFCEMVKKDSSALNLYDYAVGVVWGERIYLDADNGGVKERRVLRDTRQVDVMGFNFEGEPWPGEITASGYGFSEGVGGFGIRKCREGHLLVYGLETRAMREQGSFSRFLINPPSFE